MCQYQYFISTKHVVARLRHCFGFDVLKYCIFTDGVFEVLLNQLSDSGVIIIDSRVLYYMLFKICKSLDIKIYYLASVSNSIGSCIGVNSWINLLTVIFKTCLIVVISMKSMSMFWIVETVSLVCNQCALVIMNQINCTNVIINKAWYRFYRYDIDYCVFKSKLGGTVFIVAMFNGIITIIQHNNINNN